MMTENILALVNYRLEQADESLEAARTLLDKKLIRPSVNREPSVKVRNLIFLACQAAYVSCFCPE